MQRILILSLAYFPGTVGGAEIAIKQITDRIDPRDIEFHMITNRYDATLPKIERVGNVVVHRIGITRKRPAPGDLRKFPLHLNKYLFQIIAPLYALRLHAQYRYDGVWAMMAHATGPAVGLFSLLRPRVPFLLTLQEGDPIVRIEAMMRPVWPLFTRAFTKAALTQSISRYLDEWAEDRGARRRVIIPNGVDLERFSAPLSDEERYRVRQSLGVSNVEALIVTASRLVEKNGVDTLIEAMHELDDDVVLAVLGDGPDHEALVSLAHRIGVAERVRFLGEVAHDALPRYLAAADVFVRASRSEGQGIAFIEAMAANVATVGTAVGGIPEFLHDGETGYLARPNDPASVAAAIHRALYDPARDRVRAAARDLVRERYQWDSIARRMRTEAFASLRPLDTL